MRPDYYAVLGLPRDADGDAVRRAYRSLAARYHPDKNPGDASALARFKALVEAYGVLGDGPRRVAYDAGALSHEVATEPAGGLAELFGGIIDRVAGVRDGRPQDGRNRVYRLTVPFVDAMNGSLQTLILPTDDDCARCDGRGFEPGAIPEICDRCRGDGQLLARPFLRSTLIPCADCRGRGYLTDRPCGDCQGAGSVAGTRAFEIRLPPGVSEDQTLRVRGAGEPGRHGGRDGDCLVHVSVTAHPDLRRDGQDLVVERPITVFTALAGGRVPVPTLEGAREVKVPAGVTTGTTLRLPGLGVPSDDEGRGDLLVNLRVETPDDLDDDARDALTALAARVGLAPFPDTRAFAARYPEEPDER